MGLGLVGASREVQGPAQRGNGHGAEPRVLRRQHGHRPFDELERVDPGEAEECGGLFEGDRGSGEILGGAAGQGVGGGSGQRSPGQL